MEIKESTECRICKGNIFIARPEEEKKETLECCCCKKIIDDEGVYCKCGVAECNLKYCNLCRFQKNLSENQCFFCSGENGTIDKIESCNLCLKDLPNSLLYSFKSKNPLKICYLCISKPSFLIKTDLIVESQRLWKGNWLDCPILPSGI